MSEIPEEIKKTYPSIGTFNYPKTDKSADGQHMEKVKKLEAVFVEDSNPAREYWKGFELMEWEDGCRELRFCYYTRKRGSESWMWGQFNPIISFDKLKQLIQMIEEKKWFS